MYFQTRSWGILLTSKLEQAAQRIREVVEAQRQAVADIKAVGGDARKAEELLRQYEKGQEIAEQALKDSKGGSGQGGP